MNIYDYEVDTDFEIGVKIYNHYAPDVQLYIIADCTITWDTYDHIELGSEVIVLDWR